MGVWDATPEPKQLFFSLVQIEHPHPRYLSKNTIAGLWGTVVWVFGAPPQMPNNFSSIVHFTHRHPRYRKTPFLAHGVCSYGGVWGASPEAKQCLLVLCNSNIPIPGTIKHLCCPKGYTALGVRGATPGAKQLFWHCPFQTPPSQVSKNSFSGRWTAEVWVFGAPAQNPNNTFGTVRFKHPDPMYPKKLSWPMLYGAIGAWGTTPEA